MAQHAQCQAQHITRSSSTLFIRARWTLVCRPWRGCRTRQPSGDAPRRIRPPLIPWSNPIPTFPLRPRRFFFPVTTQDLHRHGHPHPRGQRPPRRLGLCLEAPPPPASSSPTPSSSRRSPPRRDRPSPPLLSLAFVAKSIDPCCSRSLNEPP